MRQPGKVLITGASKGIGLALAKKFLEEGWTVYACSRSRGGLKELTKKYKGRCFYQRCDISKALDIKALATKLKKDKTQINILINNAGNKGKGLSIKNLNVKEIEDLLKVHCLGTARVTQAVLPFLGGHQPTILNISSRLGSLTKNARGELKSVPTSYAYRIAKAALNMLTVCLEQELSSSIKVLAVHPGAVHLDGVPPAGKIGPTEAAKKIYLFALNSESKDLFFEPGVGSLPW